MGRLHVVGRALGGAALFVLATALLVYWVEGAFGWRAFANLEAAAIVLLGTFVMVAQAYPLRAIAAMEDRAMLDYAARCAVTMGFIGAVMGLISLLSSVMDVSEFPRRLALVLNAPLFGFILSGFVFKPLAERARTGRSRRDDGIDLKESPGLHSPGAD